MIEQIRQTKADFGHNCPVLPGFDRFCAKNDLRNTPEQSPHCRDLA
jgi:hypothetical protein